MFVSVNLHHMRIVRLYSPQDSKQIPHTPFWVLPGWPVVSVRSLMRFITHWVSLHQQVMCLGNIISLSLSLSLSRCIYVFRYNYYTSLMTSYHAGLQICLSMATSLVNLAQSWDHLSHSIFQNYPCTVHSVCLASLWGLSVQMWVNSPNSDNPTWYNGHGWNLLIDWSLVALCEETEFFLQGWSILFSLNQALCHTV